MAELLLSTDNITVIGGPDIVNLDVDFGPSGTRGSKIFSSNQNPNNSGALGSQVPNIGDWAINVSKADSEYTYMYEYISEPGGNRWTSRLKVNPAIYSENLDVIFSAGSRTITFNVQKIASLTSNQNLTAANFNIQHSIVGTNPIASSISIGSVTVTNDTLTLPITIKAAEFSEGTWSQISDTRKVHILITVV